MSLIDEALRRDRDPTLKRVRTPPKPGAAQAPSKTDPAAHAWQTQGEAESEPTRPPALGMAVLGLIVLGIWGVAVIGGRFVGDPPAPEPATIPARDPEATPSAIPAPPARRPGTLELSGIVFGDGRSYAIINGRIVTVGETIGSATLTAVRERDVTLRRANGTELTLELGS
ncbi:MAG TPA: hypothetical protein VGB20_04020 [bacterium]